MVTTVQPGDLAGHLRSGRDTAYRLAPGRHPALDLRGLRPISRIQIAGTAGAVHGPVLMSACSALLWRVLTFEGRQADAPNQMGLVQTQPDCVDIGFLGCTFQAEPDASAWEPKDWVDGLFPVGLFARGQRAVNVSGSTFRNLRNGLSLNAPGSYARGNTLTDIGNDFIRLGADNQDASGNTIRNGRHSPCEPEHADAIHVYPKSTGDRILRNITIADNDIEGGDLGDYLQGISHFDGRTIGLKILRNRIEIRAWHAIAVFGCDRVEIAENVIHRAGGEETPWIMVTKSKDGRPSTDVFVRDNVVPSLRIDPPATMLGNRVQP